MEDTSAAGFYQHNITPTATRIASTLPPSLSGCIFTPPLDPAPPVPCENPEPAPALDDELAPELVPVPDPELLFGWSSFRAPAPDTPGTLSGVELGAALPSGL